MVFEARTVDGLERGYTRLPNSILMRLTQGEFTRNEMKLVLLIARFTMSYQSRQAPLYKTVLERRTGMRGASVLEALSGLIAKGLVEKTQGDQHKPNLLGLVLPEGWDSPPKKRWNREKIRPQNHLGRKPTSVQIPTSLGHKSTPASYASDSSFKDNSRYLKIEKGPLSQFPVLQKYFSELKPQKKRERANGNVLKN